MSVAAGLGVGADQPAILANSNNTIVLLSPALTGAKVGTSRFRDAELESQTCAPCPLISPATAKAAAKEEDDS